MGSLCWLQRQQHCVWHCACCDVTHGMPCLHPTGKAVAAPRTENFRDIFGDRAVCWRRPCHWRLVWVQPCCLQSLSEALQQHAPSCVLEQVSAIQHSAIRDSVASSMQMLRATKHHGLATLCPQAPGVGFTLGWQGSAGSLLPVQTKQLWCLHRAPGTGPMQLLQCTRDHVQTEAPVVQAMPL